MNVSEIKEYARVVTANPQARRSQVNLSFGRIAEYYWDGDSFIIGCKRSARGVIDEIIKSVNFQPI